MLKKLAIAAAVLIVLVAGVVVYAAATQPDEFRVSRTASIRAPAERIHALVNEPRRHREWSPFEAKDPSMKRTYTGASAGKGAAYEWDGNSEIGAGRMAVAESSPQRIVMDMHFLRPFESRSTAEFAFQPSGETTEVTWSIYGPAQLITKVMGLFFSMDAMIGREFESGLAKLKSVTEASS